MDDINPGVQRAAAAAARRAGLNAASLADWLFALIEDDEGRPTELLQRLGVDVARVRTTLVAMTAHVIAPPAARLFSAARTLAVRLRGDPAFTTDVLMLAVLGADEGFADDLRTHGVRVEAIDAALRSAMIDPAPRDAPADVAFTLPDVSDTMDAARVVDASLNRARESLRVLDDYARFVRNDAFLTTRLKDLRHRLADLAAHLPTGALLAARDTRGDVGTVLAADGEYHRDTPRDVALINFRRLQESLRSAEEFGKLFGPHVGRDLEQMRYETYTLERVLLGSSPPRERLEAAKLYVLLTGSQCVAAMEWTLAEAAAGGAAIFQLREKELSDRELLERAQQMRLWSRKAGVLFIVNDRPDIARLSDADGVHLGQDDLSVAAARRILGPEALIGVSTHTIEQIRTAILDGADYIGIGPTFPSSTKSFAGCAGLEFITAATAETPMPAFALGGINAANLPAVVAAGAKRIAVSAAIATAEDPQLAAAQLRTLLPGR